VAEGWGLETRELQHASRDTISERWGERTHSKTQTQPSLNPSALAAVGLLLSTLGSRVGNTSLTFLPGSVFLRIGYWSLVCMYACL